MPSKSPLLPSAFALAVCAACPRAQDYDHEVLAQTGAGSLTRISYYASINDQGMVAFAGSEVNGTGVWVTDRPGSAKLVTFFPSGSRRFDGAALSNVPPYEVATRDHVVGSPGTFLIRRWPADGSQNWQLIGRSPTNFASASGYLDVNDSGVVAAQVVLAGNQRALLVGSNSSPTLVASYPSTVAVHPQIANDGKVVYRDGNNQVVVHDYATATAEVIAGFPMVGSDPGISPDGRAIAFVGDRGQGEGLFVAVYDQQAYRVFRIAGEGRDAFSDFEQETQRVGVVSGGEIATGGMSMTMCVVGTWAGVKGLYSIDASVFADASSALAVQAEAPMTVARIGDAVAGSTLAAITVSDPINGCGVIGFKADLADGTAAILRSTRRLLDVRVSVKRVLGPGAQAPGWPDSLVQAWLADASTALEKHLRVRLQVIETVDFADPHLPVSWFKVPDSSAATFMEGLAEYNPCHYKWRHDAINIYLVNEIGGAGGRCSFPLGSPPNENDIILMAPVSSSQGIALAHEIGHYFNLRHTHANFETGAGGCPGGACGDCVDDTENDADPSLSTGFASHNANLLALGYPQYQHDILRYNILSYHGPLTTADALLSCGQVLRARDALRRFRRSILATVAPPSIRATTPSSGAYRGPVQVAVDGANMPTVGQLELWVGKLFSSSFTFNSPTRKEATFSAPIEPGKHCVFLRQDNDLVVAKSGTMHITPSIVSRIQPSPFALEMTLTSSAPTTPMVLLVGTAAPSIAIPGILFELQIAPLPITVPLTTDVSGQIVLGVPLGSTPSGARFAIQAVEMIAPVWRFTNTAHVAIP